MKGERDGRDQFRFSGDMPTLSARRPNPNSEPAPTQYIYRFCFKSRHREWLPNLPT